MLYKVGSLVTAEHIVNLVLSNPETAGFQGYIESYQNGREQGLIVWTPNYKTEAYYVCEARRSDAPTVYAGQYAMQSISDNAYGHCHSFDTCQQAADWIVENIATEIAALEAA